MKKLYFFLIAAVLLGCAPQKQQTDAPVDADRYQWESIREYLFQEPERAAAMVDTAQMKGVADINYANWMRAQILLADGSKAAVAQARDYLLGILENENPKADSLQRVKTYHLLVSVGQQDPGTYEDAIRYATEGAKISHEYGWTGEEALFYSKAGETMEKVQPGSGVEYLDRSLNMMRASRNIRALPTLSSSLGNAARMAIASDDYGRAVQLIQERAQVVDRIEKEYPDAPKGFVEQQRAYIYSLLAFSQYMLGDKAAASRSARIFEQLPCSQEPEYRGHILNYYLVSGNGPRISEAYSVLEPYYRERVDTVSTNYASLLKNYAQGLDLMGRGHEAYETLSRFTVLSDSLVQRERRSETLMWAQQMKTQEKEIQLKEEEAKTRTQRLMLLAAIIIILLVGYLLVRARIYNKVLEAKNRSLYQEIQQREKAEDEERKALQARPVETLSQSQQLYRRLCEQMQDPEVFTNPEMNQDTLASLAGTNRTYVYDALRECAGQTPVDFINGYRLRHATQLLSTTDDPVALVAELCGFSRRTFYRLFNEAYSMSPSDYRKVAGK